MNASSSIAEVAGNDIRGFIAAHKVAVLYFARDGNLACRDIERFFGERFLPEFAASDVAVGRVDVADPANLETARDYAVGEVPDVVVYLRGRILNFDAPDGQIVNRVRGYSEAVGELLFGLARDVSALTEGQIRDLDPDSEESCSWGCGGGACGVPGVPTDPPGQGE
ncbi:MAG: hypothetical protein ACTSU5_19420 [Promethearchaeota archaeon]